MERFLEDVKTGSKVSQYKNREGDMLTITMIDHPLRDLLGKAFISIRPVALRVDDPQWSKILGHIVHAPGGIEIDVDATRLEDVLCLIEKFGEDFEAQIKEHSGAFWHDGQEASVLVPVTIRDSQFPPFKAVIPLKELITDYTESLPGKGPRVATVQKRCKHKPAKGDPMSLALNNCWSCFDRLWRYMAKEQGVQ